jgi:hypothetical protein
LVDGKPLPPPVAPLAPARAGATTAAGRAGAGSAATRSATPARPRLDRFAQYAWRPDSSGLTFSAAFAGGTWQLFSQSLDGSFAYTSKPFDTLVKNAPVYRPDGGQFAFVASTRGKWAVVTGPDAPGAAATSAAPATAGIALAPAPLPFDQVLAESVAYGLPRDGSNMPAALLYLAQQNKKWRLYTDHRPGEDSFDAIVLSTFVVSPDQRHFAFAAIRGKQQVIVRDGTVLATHDEVAGSTFAFSPDSQHLAYAARNGANWFACVDGTPGYPFTAIAGSAIAFSPDSRRIAYTAATGTKDWHLVIGKDGEWRSKPYEAFLKGSHVTWRPDGTVVTLAILKKVATRVEAKP